MRFVYNAPAILHRGTLIIGDTHFGMERKLERKGIHAHDFSDNLFQKLKNLIIKNKVKRLIIIGDVKDDITVCDEKTKDIIAKLQLLADVILVRGNHDGGIEETGAQVIDSGGFVYGKIGLAHGHAWPDEKLLQCDYLVIAHHHPLASFEDKLGKKHTEPVWIFAEPIAENLSRHYKTFNKKIKLIIIPAFNPLVGYPVYSYKKKSFGPIFDNKLFKFDDALLFKLNGISFGALKHLGFDFYGKKKKRS